MANKPNHFARAIEAATIWRDPAVAPADRRRARKRFDYALAKLATGELTRLHVHLLLVAEADARLRKAVVRENVSRATGKKKEESVL